MNSKQVKPEGCLYPEGLITRLFLFGLQVDGPIAVVVGGGKSAYKWQFTVLYLSIPTHPTPSMLHTTMWSKQKKLLVYM